MRASIYLVRALQVSLCVALFMVIITSDLTKKGLMWMIIIAALVGLLLEIIAVVKFKKQPIVLKPHEKRYFAIGLGILAMIAWIILWFK